jgi:hypothetical protein
VKIGASEGTTGLSFAGPTGTSNTWVTITADGSRSSMILKNEDGSEQVIQP